MKAQRKTKTRNTLRAKRRTKKKQRVMKRQRQKGGGDGANPDANPDANPPAEAGAANPPADGENPAAEDANPPADGENPAAEDANPPADGENPAAEDANPAGQDEKPATEDANPPGEANPPGQDGEPPAEDTNPPGQDGEPPAEDTNPPGQGGASLTEQGGQDGASTSGTSETPEATAQKPPATEAPTKGGQASAQPNEGQDCEEQTRLFTTRLMELEGYVRYYNTRIQEISSSAGTAKDQLGELKEFIEGIQKMFESLQRMEPMMAPKFPGITPGQMTGIPQPQMSLNLGLQGESETDKRQANVGNANVNTGTEKAKGNGKASAEGNGVKGVTKPGPSNESNRGGKPDGAQNAGSIDKKKLQEIIKLFKNVQACDYGDERCSKNKPINQSGGAKPILELQPRARQKNLVNQSIDYLQEIKKKLNTQGNESLKNLIDAAIFCSVGNNYYRQFLNIDDMVKFFSVGADGANSAGSIILGQERYERLGSEAPVIQRTREVNQDKSANSVQSTTLVKRMYNFLLDYERFYKILDEVKDSANLNEIIQSCYRFGFIIRFGYLILFMIYFFVDKTFDKIVVNPFGGGSHVDLEIIQKYFSRLDMTSFLYFIGDNNELISVTMDYALDENIFKQYTYPYHNYKLAINHLAKLSDEQKGVIDIDGLYKAYFKVEFGELGTMIKNAIEKTGEPKQISFPSKIEHQMPATDVSTPGAVLQYIIKKDMYKQVFSDTVTQLLDEQQKENEVRRIDDNEDPTYFDIVYNGLVAMKASEGFGPDKEYKYVPLPKQDDYLKNESNIKTPKDFFRGLFKTKKGGRRRKRPSALDLADTDEEDA